MRVLVIGAGAMGGALGATLHDGGHRVTLLDVDKELVARVNAKGLIVETSAGERTVNIPATTDPAAIDEIDLALVFVKSYHAEGAVRFALPAIGERATVLTLQNGWGNIDHIAKALPKKRIMAGVTYHSAMVRSKGRIYHGGQGTTYMGELDGRLSDRLNDVVRAFSQSGLEVVPSENVIQMIWQKLALNVATLPIAAITRRDAGQLYTSEDACAVSQLALREACAVAWKLGIELDFDERWSTITGVLERAGKAKPSMLQDVENRRRTEIDVINGAIAAAGRENGVPTPANDVLVHLVKSIERLYLQENEEAAAS